MRAVLVLMAMALPAAAQEAWEIPAAEQDVPSRNAVYRANQCLDLQYASFGRYGDCADVVFAGCRAWEGKGFGARDCLDEAHATWRHLVWDLTARLADRGTGGQAGGRPPPEAALEHWEAFAEAHCGYGLSPAHPYDDDPDWQRRACLTELAAAQAIRLWVTLAP